MIRAIVAIVAGAITWKAVVMLATLLGRFVWPAYAAVEEQRVFDLEMLISRLTVGGVATLAFGAVVAWVAQGNQKTIRMIILAWLLYSVVDHITVWDQFPIWYHLLYLAYIVPLALVGSRIIRRTAIE